MHISDMRKINLSFLSLRFILIKEDLRNIQIKTRLYTSSANIGPIPFVWDQEFLNLPTIQRFIEKNKSSTLALMPASAGLSKSLFWSLVDLDFWDFGISNITVKKLTGQLSKHIPIVLDKFKKRKIYFYQPLFGEPRFLRLFGRFIICCINVPSRNSPVVFY